MFFEKIKYLASIYKSGGLSGKLPKGQYIYIYINIYIYIYKGVYFILKSTTL